MIVYLNARDGSFADLLAEQAQIAESMGLKPFVDWYASWCGPCNTLAGYIEAEDPYIVDALQGTYIVKLDCDDNWDWWDVEDMGYVFEFIPVFFEMQPDGSAGDWIDGGSFMADNPEDIAAALKAFFDTGH